jgi:hypothetical protein
MDSEQLKARSIELAERAYRQKDRATEFESRAALDDTADELIKTGSLELGSDLAVRSSAIALHYLP